ncbi:hypothetical protein BB561_005457 [Smittium simulii]|uniref:Cullin family profile domain-containing protein n=1 Tax=Smittium simulii TaxID=133385 RepID=A0A2T9YAB3_9FUNG|nr:hypothetical protein BB561_005457 [Smittium simulii]
MSLQPDSLQLTSHHYLLQARSQHLHFIIPNWPTQQSVYDYTFSANLIASITEKNKTIDYATFCHSLDSTLSFLDFGLIFVLVSDGTLRIYSAALNPETSPWAHRFTIKNSLFHITAFAPLNVTINNQTKTAVICGFEQGLIGLYIFDKQWKLLTIAKLLDSNAHRINLVKNSYSVTPNFIIAESTHISKLDFFVDTFDGSSLKLSLNYNSYDDSLACDNQGISFSIVHQISILKDRFVNFSFHTLRLSIFTRIGLLQIVEYDSKGEFILTNINIPISKQIVGCHITLPSFNTENTDNSKIYIISSDLQIFCYIKVDSEWCCSLEIEKLLKDAFESKCKNILVNSDLALLAKGSVITPNNRHLIISLCLPKRSHMSLPQDWNEFIYLPLYNNEDSVITNAKNNSISGCNRGSNLPGTILKSINKMLAFDISDTSCDLKYFCWDLFWSIDTKEQSYFVAKELMDIKLFDLDIGPKTILDTITNLDLDLLESSDKIDKTVLDTITNLDLLESSDKIDKTVLDTITNLDLDLLERTAELDKSLQNSNSLAQLSNPNTFLSGKHIYLSTICIFFSCFKVLNQSELLFKGNNIFQILIALQILKISETIKGYNNPLTKPDREYLSHLKSLSLLWRKSQDSKSNTFDSEIEQKLKFKAEDVTTKVNLIETALDNLDIQLNIIIEKNNTDTESNLVCFICSQEIVDIYGNLEIICAHGHSTALCSKTLQVLDMLQVKSCTLCGMKSKPLLYRQSNTQNDYKEQELHQSSNSLISDSFLVVNSLKLEHKLLFFNKLSFLMNVRPIKKPKTIAPAKRLMAKKTPEQMLEIITGAIRDIYDQNASTLSYEELYRSAYNLVIAKKSETLYISAANCITEIVAHKSLSILGKNTDCNITLDSGLNLLKKIIGLWELHTNSIRLIHDILIYLDNVYVLSARKLHIYDLGLLIFEEQVLLNPKFNFLNSIAKTTTLVIEHERNGFFTDTTVIKKAIDMALETKTRAENSTNNINGKNSRTTVSLFEYYFKPEIISSSQHYYKTQFTNIPENLSLTGFFLMIKMKKADEISRAKRYLTEEIGQNIVTIITNELLIPYSAEKLELQKSELDPILGDPKLDDLNLIYCEAASVPSIKDQLLHIISNHIFIKCTTILNQELEKSLENLSISASKSEQAKSLFIATNWVESIFKYYNHYLSLAQQSFVNNREFQAMVNESFAKVTLKNSLSAQYICLYLDDQIRRGFKGKSDKETEVILDLTIVLFRFLPDKDIFEMFMRQKLSKRLLSLHNSSLSIETSFIYKLKMECGPQYTQRLEGMLKDIQLSADISKEFSESLEDHSNTGAVQLFASVLTYTHWPLSQISIGQIQENNHSILTLPTRVENIADQFTKFYKKKFAGRKFIWLNNMGTAEISARFKSSNYELTVSTVQMLILDLFNISSDDFSLTWNEILAKTCVEELELIRNLQSLACTKYKLLIKTPMSREINKNDSFHLNLNFAAPNKKYRVPMIVASKTNNPGVDSNQSGDQVDSLVGNQNIYGNLNSLNAPIVDPNQNINSEELSADLSKLQEERRYMIDATIVRILKSYKSIDHANLVAETIEQVKSRFQPAPVLIKSRIDSLIDRDYIERSSKDRKIYIYIA